MKEGYLQTKIADITEKCNRIEQLILLENSKLKLLQKKVGNYKTLIKKFDDLEDYKNKMIRQIKNENQEIIEEIIQKLSKNISNNIDSILNSKTQKIDETFDFLKKRGKEIDIYNEKILQQSNEINYLIKHNDLLMMKLVNKGILSDRETNELNIRASKKN